MNTFEVLYFDGVSSASSQRSLLLEPDRFIIRSEYEKITWNVSAIHPVEFADKHLLILKYGDRFPYETIEIKNPKLIQIMLTDYGLGKRSRKYGLVLNHGWKGIFIAAAILVAVILGGYFYVIPSVAENAAAHLPKEWEERFGNTVYQNMMWQFEEDTFKTRQVQKFYNELGYTSEFDVKITVVDKDQINAFATPGGRIVVFSGILDEMESPEELAALLSHEVAHVNEHHSTKSIFRALANSLLLSILLNDANGISSVLVANANNIQALSYSRSLETEADNEGLEMMLDNNINPEGMEKLFERLGEHKHDFNIPEILSTHPLTEDRLNNAKSFSQKTSGNYRDLNQWESWLLLQGDTTFKD